jgi:hypothetical protein
MVSVSAKAVAGLRSKETEKGVRHFHDIVLWSICARLCDFVLSGGVEASVKL